jgi:response regulator RpfG family c-di-GMP phosphodiesterase
MRLIDSQSYNVQGMALLKEIKGDRPATGAIILTGYPDSEQRDKALNIYSADAYIEKVPQEGAFDVDGFVQLLESLVKRRHL